MRVVFNLNKCSEAIYICMFFDFQAASVHLKDKCTYASSNKSILQSISSFKNSSLLIKYSEVIKR